MSKLPPRGSSKWFNAQFQVALERGKAQIDNALEVLGDIAPLTKKLTLRELNKLSPEDAVMELQMELRRTMKADEMTGTPIPDNETIQLIRDYMAQGVNDAELA